MSSASGKKMTTKDDLRRLMETKKYSLSSQEKKIDSPLAKYNNFGQLSCVACNCPLKSEVLWNSHILKKQHKENVALYKKQMLEKPTGSVAQLKPPPSKSTAQKRSLDEPDVLHDSKKFRKSNSEVLGTSIPQQQSKIPVASNLLGTSNYESEEEEEDGDESKMDVDVDSFHQTSLPHTSSSVVQQNPGLSNAANGSSSNSSKGQQQVPEGLPEGFMDDPVMDAKVRNVPYKDKMEVELELFQKEIKQQQTVSAALLEEDEEKREKERELYEVEEQMHNYSRILKIVKEKDESVKTVGIQQRRRIFDDDVSDSDDDDDVSANWRAKTAVKH